MTDDGPVFREGSALEKTIPMRYALGTLCGVLRDLDLDAHEMLVLRVDTNAPYGHLTLWRLRKEKMVEMRERYGSPRLSIHENKAGDERHVYARWEFPGQAVLEILDGSPRLSIHENKAGDERHVYARWEFPGQAVVEVLDWPAKVTAAKIEDAVQ